MQVHLAGHTDNGTHCIDTHDGRVIDDVWELYRRVHERTGGRATLLEWDANIPKFPVLQREVRKARGFAMAGSPPPERWRREPARRAAAGDAANAGCRPWSCTRGRRRRPALPAGTPPVAGGGGRARDVVLPSKSLSSVERLDIYAHMYYARLLEILVDEYPTTRQILGPEFSRACRRFLARHPSRIARSIS